MRLRCDHSRIARTGLVAVCWDGKAYRDRPVAHPFAFLRKTVEIEADVTLGDIFRVVDTYPDLVDFITAYADCDVRAFHAEARRPFTPDPSERFPLDHLRIRMIPIIGWEYEGVREFDLRIDFDGIGPGEDAFTNAPVAAMPYAIEFTPVNHLVHLPVRLDRDISVCNEQKLKIEMEFPCRTTYSLLEVLDAIYYEISSNGSPSLRDRKGRFLTRKSEDTP